MILKSRDVKEGELPINRIVLGDASYVLKRFPDHSIDVVFTDPPYFESAKHGVGVYESYQRVLPELSRVMKEDAWLFVYLPSNRLDVFLKDTIKFFEYVDRFVVEFVSTKTKGAFGDKRTLELCVFRKGKPKVFERFFTDVLVGIEDPLIVTMHPKNPMWKPTLPTALILRKVVGVSRDKVLLDPFMGYGSIVLVAKHLGMKWIGIEINLDFAKKAERILKGEEPRDVIGKGKSNDKNKQSVLLSSRLF